MLMNRRRLLARLGWGIGAALGARLVPEDDRLLAWAGDEPPTAAFRPDVEVALKATGAQASILSGDPTEVWSLQGQLLRGDRRSLESPPTSAIGPTFRVHTGQKVRVVFTNDIPQRTILHWHGLRIPAVADGHPRFAVPRGGQYVYEFQIAGPAGTYWYHAHPDVRTGEQVYRGLARSSAAKGLPMRATWTAGGRTRCWSCPGRRQPS